MESFALQQYPIATAVSPDDCSALKALCPMARVECIPNGVDLDKFAPVQGIEPIPGRMIMFGNMDFLPNIDAAICAATEVLPMVQTQIPEAHLQIVGTNPVSEVLNLNSLNGVEVVGEVPELAPVISSANLLLAPMRYGAGIKNKVLETLACERAVVTTSLSMSALHQEAQDLLKIGNTSKELATYAIDLLENPESRIAIGREGRKVMSRRHSWRAAAARYAELLGELIECR